jgi:hypothetical protein
MAYQSKNHRKFLATSLTAAMVASAVAPAVSAASFPDVKDDNFYAPYVNQLADAGIIEGMPNGTFGLRAKVTRAEAAKMVSIIRGLDTKNAPAANFDDVKQGVWYSEYINALYQEKLVDGISDEEFAPNGTLTRAQFAKLVVDAYDLDLKPETKTPFTDVKEDVWYTDYVKTLYANGLINGKTATTFEPNSTIDRADFAKLLVDADLKFGFTLGKASVSAVTATNPTTLTLTGTALKNLTVADVTVEGVKVTSVTPAADGKTAAVKLEGPMVKGKSYKVSVKVGEETKEFTVTFEYEITKVTLNEKSYDDDTSNQLLTFRVNSESVDADYNDLLQQGYDVEFSAVDSNGNAAAIFQTGKNKSTTGLLASEVPAGKYVVEVLVTLDNKFVVSDKGTIEVKDIEGLATTVESAVFQNGKGFYHSSTTLIEDETATVAKVVGDFAGKDGVSIPLNTVEVTSDNPAVISVSGTTIKANAPGTATVTVKSGSAQKAITFTVKDNTAANQRVVDEVSLFNASTVKLLDGSKRRYQLDAEDQYGDPINVSGSDLDYSIPVNGAENDLVSITPFTGTGSNVLALDITAEEAGKGTVIVSSDASGLEVGRFAIDVTSSETTPYKHEVWLNGNTESRDFNLSLNDTSDDEVTFNLAKLTNGGYYVANETLVAADDNANFYYQIADTSVVTATGNGTASVKLTAASAGTTEVIVRNAADQVVDRFTVTVTSTSTYATDVNWKTASTVTAVGGDVDITTVLDVRGDKIGANTVDSIVYGIDHNAKTGAKVRVNDVDYGTGDTAADTDAPVLYIDLDNDGIYESSDAYLGTLTATPLTGFNPGTSSDFTAGTAFDLIGGSTPEAVRGDKGTLLFKLVNVNNNKTISSTTVNVDVK